MKYIYNSGDFNFIRDYLNEKNCLEILSISNSIGMEDFSDSLSNYIVDNFLNKDNCLKFYNDILNVIKFFCFILF